MPEPRHFDERRKNPRAWAKLRVYTRPLLAAELGELIPTLGTKTPRIPELAVADPTAEAEGIMRLMSADISMGGINATGDVDLVSQREMPMGHDLVVEIELPDGKERLKAVGQVMWTSTKEASQIRAGLMFTAISEKNLKRLHDYLETQGVTPLKGRLWKD